MSMNDETTAAAMPSSGDGSETAAVAVPLAPQLNDPTREIETMAAAAVEPEPVDWLWPGRLALGTLGLVLGDPDNGKSLLTLDMAARVSRGRPWPDGAPCPLGQVLLVTCEDSVANTIRPRLEAAGADLDRVHIFRATKANHLVRRDFGATIAKDGHDGTVVEPGRFNFSLRTDLGSLEDWLAKAGDVKLIVLDPLGAYADGANTHKDSDTRALLMPFAGLAKRRAASIVGIVHTNKSPGGKALYRASGSLAFVAAARHVYALGRDRCDPTRRLMARVKNNLSGDETGMAFAIQSGAGGHPVIVWEPEPIAIDAEGVLDGGETSLGKEEEAVEWLRTLLADGPVRASFIHACARDDLLSWRTVRRAKERLGAIAVRAGGLGWEGVWSWKLPR